MLFLYTQLLLMNIQKYEEIIYILRNNVIFNIFKY